MKHKVILAALLLFTLYSNAQTGVSNPGFAAVDSRISDFLRTWNIPGAEVAITKDGKLIYNKGFGFSDQERSVPAQPYNLYRIASVSKPITAIAIMKLIQEKKLALTDTVFGKGKILDQTYYLSAIADKRIFSITIQNLLEHTAGWDRDVPCDGYSHSDPAFFPLHVSAVIGEANPVGDSTLIKFLLKKGLDHAPGTTYAYSNVGYLVLGKVIEKISGMSYETYLEKNIFSPLAIDNIHLGKNLLTDGLEREAEYSGSSTTRSCYGDGKKVPWQYGGFNVEAMNAHGGWVATAADLTRLMLAVDGFSSSPDILNPPTIRLMGKPSSVHSSYAKGWSVNPKNNWWHTGSMDGTAAFVCRTNDGYTWAFLFNSRADNSGAFWNAVDRLPWDCLNAITSVPEINLYSPTVNVSKISAVVVNQNSVKLSWANGNGNKRMIVITEKASFQNFPVDGTGYAANPAFGHGANLGAGTFVVYNGTGNSVTVTNLDPSKTYIVTGIEYYKNRNTGNYEVYKSGANDKLSITTKPVFARKVSAAGEKSRSANQ